MRESPPAFPFAAVAGMEMAKQALLLLAVDPGLKGVLIQAGPGRAKSLLVRGFQALAPGPFIEAPAGVTEDQLLGGLDLERTLATGVRHAAPGLLARAHGGFVCVNEANLLDQTAVRHLAHALTSGLVRLEREGIGAEFQSGFAFIGTYDAGEGCVDASLAEAAGLHVHEDGLLSGPQRAGMLERVAAYHSAPAAFCRKYAAESGLLRDRIAAARALLPRVEIGANDLRRLVRAAMCAGAASHRADVFAVRCAKASAAFMKRKLVEEEDLIVATRLVLSPRAVSAAPPAAGPQPVESDGESSSGERGEDMKFDAIDCGIPEDLAEVVNAAGQPGRRRNAAAAKQSWERGRYIRAVAARPGAHRIAITATLVAAVRRGSRSPIRIGKQDLRYKEFRQKAGVLTIFVVDSSGSMALSRMDQAKGALIRLLQKAYVYRDRVALIGFRGDRADVLLPPSRSVELAKRALDSLAVGGGTPLAAGLRATLELATRQTDASQTLMVLLTDGRANVGGPDKLERACAALRTKRVGAVVIDNRDRFAAGGETERLAKLLDGRHVYLNRPGSDSVYSIVAEATEGLRGHGA